MKNQTANTLTISASSLSLTPLSGSVKAIFARHGLSSSAAPTATTGRQGKLYSCFGHASGSVGYVADYALFQGGNMIEILFTIAMSQDGILLRQKLQNQHLQQKHTLNGFDEFKALDCALTKLMWSGSGQPAAYHEFCKKHGLGHAKAWQEMTEALAPLQEKVKNFRKYLKGFMLTQKHIFGSQDPTVKEIQAYLLTLKSRLETALNVQTSQEIAWKVREVQAAPVPEITDEMWTPPKTTVIRRK